MVFVHVRNCGVVLREKCKHKGRRASREVVDVVERERSYNENEEKRREKDGVRQC